MLENYERDKSGAIKQVVTETFNYDRKYVDDSCVDNNELAILRLGVLIGAINKPIRELLDVGYGNGFFLKWASKTVQRCYGYDIEPAYPLPKNALKAESILGNNYDVVTFYNSLPCFRNLDFINQIKCQYIVATVPWCHNTSDEWFESWEERKPDEYVWHFNDETLQRFMLTKGYTLIHFSNIEDTIKGQVRIGLPSFLTGIFKKN